MGLLKGLIILLMMFCGYTGWGLFYSHVLDKTGGGTYDGKAVPGTDWRNWNQAKSDSTFRAVWADEIEYQRQLDSTAADSTQKAKTVDTHR